VSGDGTASNRVLWTSRSYRLLFLARLISNIGNGIAPIAIAFGVLGLPGSSPTSLSIVLAAQAIPLVLLLPMGGVIADRLGRARVIGWTDVILSGFVLATAVLFLTDQATIPLLAALGFAGGCLNALWFPAFTGLIPDVIADEHLKPANAFISVASNGGLIAGSAIGGILVATVGPGYAIAMDAISFLIAGLMVLTFRGVSQPSQSGESMVGDLVHGWRVFWSIRWVVVVVTTSSVVVMVWRGAEQVMGPVISQESYGGPTGWSLVLAFQAVGLLVGALVATALRIRRPLVASLVAMLALPAWLLTMAFTLPLPLVAFASFGFGVALEFFWVLWSTALQSHVPRESLSRVSSYDAMGSLMLGPIGLAVAGPMIAILGSTEALLIAAAVGGAAILAPLLSGSVRGLRGSGQAELAPN
jgi:hypothetical protein